MSLERIFKIRPAWDKRDPDPRKNYGVHGVEFAFFVKGSEGAIQFILYSNWQLPHVQAETDARMLASVFDEGLLSCFYHPRAFDIGYHSPKPIYEDQTPMGAPGDCEFVPAGCPCYYDGSSLNADRFLAILIEGGDEKLWEALEAKYRECFLSAGEGGTPR